MEDKKVNEINFRINLFNILMTNFNYIPDFVINNLNFFKQIDNEYTNNIKKKNISNKLMFNPKYINKQWRGLWLRATGMDEKLYANWLFAGIKFENKRYILKEWYKEAHPNEKYIPNSILRAQEDIYKLYN
jgi:hypothetical protein